MIIKLLSFVSIGLSGLAIIAVLFGWLMFVIFLDSGGDHSSAFLKASIIALLAMAIPLYVLITLRWNSQNLSEGHRNIIMALGIIYPLILVVLFKGTIFLDNKKFKKQESAEIKIVEEEIKTYTTTKKVLSDTELKNLLSDTMILNDVTSIMPLWNELVKNNQIDPNKLIVRDYGTSPILLEILGGFEDKRFALSLLENGADPNMSNNNGENALIAFVKSTYKSEKNLEVLRKIISCGVDMKKTDEEGNTAIDYLTEEKENTTSRGDWYDVLNKEIEIINNAEQNLDDLGSCK